MRNLKRWMLCGLAAMMLMTGCSKKEEPETTTATESDQTQEEVDMGTVSELGTYLGVEVTKMSTSVSDEELDAKIQSILTANPERVAVLDRAAELGDIVNIDYVGMLDGEAFQGGTDAGYDLVLGSNSFIDGFEDGLVGANVGDELSLNLTFPEEYPSADLAGKEVVFAVTVNSIKEDQEAVLDNNFVQRMSEFNTVDEFKADTLTDLEADKEVQAEQQVENDAIITAIANSQYAINEESVEQLAQQELEYSKIMYPQSYGIEFTDYLAMTGQTEEQFVESMKDSIRQSFEWELLVEAIIEKEGLAVSSEDIEILAALYEMTVDELETQIGEDTVNEAAKKHKVYLLIVDNAVVK
ncbi:MAG: trigger factor [Lachnospiraceae bacterium]